MEGLTPAASEGGARGLFSSGEGVMVLWPRGPCLIPFARGSGASFDGGKVLFARLAGPRLYRGRVPFARGVFIHKGLSDGERVRGAPRRAPDTPGSRPTKSPLRGSLASVSSLQVGRDATSCSSRPQARITRPIPGPRPFGAAASGVQKRSRRFCPCGDDLARQFRLGDFDAGPSPNFGFFMFY